MDVANLCKALGAVECASSAELRRGVGFDKEFHISKLFCFVSGGVKKECSETLAMQIGFDGKPAEPDILWRTPEVLVEACDTSNSGVFDQNIVAPSVVDAVVFAGEVEVESIEGLVGFLWVHCAADEMYNGIDVPLCHWPKGGLNSMDLWSLIEGTVRAGNCQNLVFIELQRLSGSTRFPIYGKLYMLESFPTSGKIMANLAIRLGNKLQQLRGEQSQLQFSRKLGISKSSLNRMELGEQNVSLKTLETLCNRLGCKVGDLFAE